MNDPKPMNRRDFMEKATRATAGLGLLAAGMGGMAATAKGEEMKQTPAQRPNVLLFLTDQERSVHLPPLDLPSRDRIKKTAVEFVHAHAANPLCSPGRACLLTGLYTHQHGVLDNTGSPSIKLTQPLDPSIPNLGGVFRRAGYETGYFGKLHLTDPLASADRQPPLNAYGFQDFWVTPGENEGVKYDAEAARKAAAWIAARNPTTPWLAVVSIINPHDLFYANWYNDREIPQRDIQFPPNVLDDAGGPDRPGEIQTEAGRGRKAGMLPMTEEQRLRLMRRYAHLIERADGQLGVVLDALEKSGGWENTIVVYTSDHGEMGGSHGLINKRFMYSESVCVPLLISWPDLYRRPVRSDLLVSHVDIAPTVADMAGVSWPTALPGRSLKDAPSPGLSEFADPVFAESHLPPFPVARDGLDLVKMVRTKAWKYVRYPSGAEELFHESEDPYEMKNLAADPRHAETVARLRKTIQDWLEATQKRPS